jgi:transcription antitermination factor NusG
MKHQQQQIRQKHEIPILDFDKKLLHEINHKCLPPNEEITIEYQGHYYFEDDEPHEEEIFHVYLKKNNKIVSRIELMFKKDEDHDLFDDMIIQSNTEQQYRRLHYNTILRSVIVLLMPSMTIQKRRIEKVYSEAQNYLSVYSLAKLGFIVEEFEGFFQGFNLSFYSPYQQLNQQQRVVKQKQLKQYIRSKYQNQEQDFHEARMVLLKTDYQKSFTLAKNMLNRLCENCLKQTTKRKHQQQKKQT